MWLYLEIFATLGLYAVHIGSFLLIHKEKSNKMQQCIKILLFHI